MGRALESCVAVVTGASRGAGRGIARELGAAGAFIAKSAKNVAVAKDFLRYVIQPANLNLYLKTGLGRWLPPMPHLVKEDPFWLKEDPHRTAYATEGMIDPTVPNYPCFNPGYAEANAQQVWGIAVADIVRDGMTVQAAADKALELAREAHRLAPDLVPADFLGVAYGVREAVPLLVWRLAQSVMAGLASVFFLLLLLSQ
jgi:hypothetical protein